MAEKEIEIIIDEDGNVSLEQFGWTGSDCEHAIDDLIKALGTEVSKKRTKEHAKTKGKVQAKKGAK